MTTLSRTLTFGVFLCACIATSVQGTEATIKGISDELLLLELRLPQKNNEGGRVAPPEQEEILFRDDNDKEMARQKLLAHRQDRKLKFEQLLGDVRDQLQDAPGDERLQRKATAYERKLESLSEELSDQQLEHMIAREEHFLSEQPESIRNDGESWSSSTSRGLRGAVMMNKV